MCSTQKQLRCQCFTTQHFTFNRTAQNVLTEEIAWESGDLIGKWCVLKYDNDLYPGIILNTDEVHALVKCMHHAGANRFFWPARDDILSLMRCSKSFKHHSLWHPVTWKSREMYGSDSPSHCHDALEANEDVRVPNLLRKTFCRTFSITLWMCKVGAP